MNDSRCCGLPSYFVLMVFDQTLSVHSCMCVVSLSSRHLSTFHKFLTKIVILNGRFHQFEVTNLAKNDDENNHNLKFISLNNLY